MVSSKNRYNVDALLGGDLDDTTPSKLESTPKESSDTSSPAIRSLLGTKKAKSGVEAERERSQKEIKHIKVKAEEEVRVAKKEVDELREKFAGREGGRNQLVLTMPITQQDVSFTLEYIDPALIDISPENERDQEFLDEVSLRDLLPDIKKYGQQYPGTVRPKVGGRYELIEGSRRRKCCDFAGIKFKTFVGQVPDADVRVLSVSENIKKDVSPYEKGISYKKQIDSGEFESWTELAIAKRISTSTASRLKSLAELPVRFIKILPTPSAMSVKYGDEMSALRKKNEAALEEKVSELLELRQNVSSPRDYPEYEEIVKILKSAARIKIQVPTTTSPKLYESKSSECFLKHSVSNKGTTKFELSGASDQQVAQILKVIAKELKLVI